MKLTAIKAAANEGRKFIREGGVLPESMDALDTILDDLYVRHDVIWDEIFKYIDVIQADSAFYTGAAMEAELYGLNH